MDETRLYSDDRKLGLHGVRPMSEAGDLCTQCEVAMHELVWPKIDAAQGILEGEPRDVLQPVVGWLDRLIATKDCALCQFLAPIFFLNLAAFAEAEITNHRRFLCSFALVKPRLSPGSGMICDWDIDVRFQEVRDKDAGALQLVQRKKLYYRSTFQLMAGSASVLADYPDGYQEGDVLSNLCRPIPELCSREFIGRTYKECLRSHGSRCENLKTVFLSDGEVRHSEDRFPARLIDVVKHQVVGLSEPRPYVALSYCWARKPYLRLLRTNLQALEEAGGINTDLLAPTIADALQVTEILGERYLWVDSLCIVQDDSTDKSTEIAKMDTIYRHAALTIVGAGSAADGSDFGLPGIRAGSRTAQQHTVEIRGLTFAATGPTLLTVLEASRWQKRAWTYQEHVLSRRELIFTPYQAYFSCECDSFAEGHIKRACVHERPDETSQSCCSYRTPENSDDYGHTTSNNSVASYEVLVREISSRDSSFESDVLRAITGVLSLIHSGTRAYFLCGVPIPRLLSHGIFWLPRGKCRRRAHASDRLPFPSWSWIGWVGPVVYPFDVEETLITYQHNTHVDELLVDHWEAEHSEGLSSASTSERNVSRYAEDDLAKLDYRLSLTLESALLRFTAPCAKVPVSHFAWGTVLDCEGLASRCHAVSIDDTCAGLVIFNTDNEIPSDRDLVGRTQKDAWAMSLRHVGDFELLALSTTNHHWSLFFPMHADPNNEANFYHHFDELDERDHCPFDTDKWNPDDPVVVNVLVVEWQGDVAFRRGVGQIHAEAWELACTARKAIRLG